MATVDDDAELPEEHRARRRAAHRRAADAHERAAHVHDEAALFMDELGLRERADEHRAAASLNWEQAEDEHREADRYTR